MLSETLGRIYLWFYCLPLGDIALLAVLASAVFLLVKHRFDSTRLWRVAVGGVLVVCIAALLYVTLGNRDPGNAATLSLQPFHSYREAVRTGNIEIYRSIFMNGLLFYPAGLLAAALLPRRWHWLWRVLLVTVVLAALSAGIEYLQYTYALGKVEIDDVIHNTLGSLLGSLVGCIHLPLDTKNT